MILIYYKDLILCWVLIAVGLIVLWNLCPCACHAPEPAYEPQHCYPPGGALVTPEDALDAECEAHAETKTLLKEQALALLRVVGDMDVLCVSVRICRETKDKLITYRIPRKGGD